ncbi:C39 family peptidase [Agriterribacter humi]|uniref:C39 family peptidase n=1 Tax=Agriterribacter humi TaxID=1104781 RepID=UPI00186AD314|nr:C39 family peptidase [Agriterribacter humi]
MPSKYVFGCLVAITLLCKSFNSVGQEQALDIDPVLQETPVWCWVSCGEMIFRYYDICNINPAGNFQCGIIALLGPQCNANCFACPYSAESTQRIINMLDQYPRFAQQVCGSSKQSVRCTNVYGALSQQQIMDDIDNGWPILAGINPSGGVYGTESQHAVLIIGYEVEDEIFNLIINDPFPYHAVSSSASPYEQYSGEEIISGQYKIPYARFRTNLGWNRTLKSIR